jgi:DNA repair protein RecO (recombination protein O)
MLHKTRGIVFRTVKYSDTSVIARIYTEKFGLRSYIIRAIKGKKSSSKIALLQHLSLLNLVVYEKDRGGIQNIKEMESARQFSSIPFDFIKSSVLLFLNEILYKAVHEEEANQSLFDYIFDSLCQFDEAAGGIENYHLHFTLGLTKFLGFYPRNNFSGQNEYFDLREGIFVENRPFHNNFMEPLQSRKLYQMLDTEMSQVSLFENSGERNAMLVNILDYFKLHVPGFIEIKSLPVLQQVLR